MRILRPPAVFAVLLAFGLSPTVARAQEDQPTGTVTCTYVEAGAPGPIDNRLSVSVQGFEAALFRRIGERIVVTGADFFQPELPCGTPPTVSNLDRIDVQAAGESLGAIPFVDALLGGAAPETDGSSEIEMSLVQPRAIAVVWGSGGSDQIVVGTTAAGNTGVSIGTGEVAPDIDIEVTGQGASVSGFGGADVLSGLGGGLLGAGTGKANFHGGPGNDLITGGPGRDYIADGRGRDRVDAGAGSDAVYSQRSGKDRLRCRGGRDRVAVSKPDRIRGCEKVVRDRVSEFEFQFKIPIDLPFVSQTG